VRDSQPPTQAFTALRVDHETMAIAAVWTERSEARDLAHVAPGRNGDILHCRWRAQVDYPSLVPNLGEFRGHRPM
jgi:hypothetical protein